MSGLRLSACLCSVFLLAAATLHGQPTPQVPEQSQNAAPADPVDPEAEHKRPLTPEEERARQVKEFDPLDRTPDVTPDSGQANPTQNTPDPTQSNSPSQAAAPLPNSIAASNQDAASRRGPQVIGDGDSAAAQEYTGPAVLSRSYSLNRPFTPETLKWHEALGVSTVYDSGVVSASTDQAGSINDTSSFGNQITWGFGGRHYWRKDQLGLSFQGNYTTGGAQAASGSNMGLNLDYSHVITRRLSLQVSATGSILSQNYALQNPAVAAETTIANINLSTSPDVQIFDNGTKQLNTHVALEWQQNARLSFSFGGAWFTTVRDASALIGVTGEQANADVNYRLTRKTTIGAYYSFSYYLYPKGTGQSDTHTVGGIYSNALTKSTQLRFRGGISHTETLGLETVPILDPLIVALLGQSSGIIDAYHASNGADISAEFVHDFRGARTANVSYADGITPGNGVFLTSQQRTISAGFNARFFRRYSLGLGAGQSTLSSQAQTLGKYTSQYVTVSVSRAFPRGISSVFSFNYRHFAIFDAPGAGNEFRVTAGASWSPTNSRLWPF